LKVVTEDGKVEILFQTPAGYSIHTSAFTADNHAGLVEGEFHCNSTNPGGDTEGIAVRYVLQKVSELEKVGTPPTLSSVST
jgi:hypothetical protein